MPKKPAHRAGFFSLVVSRGFNIIWFCSTFGEQNERRKTKDERRKTKDERRKTKDERRKNFVKFC